MAGTFKHGLSKTSHYKRWGAMLDRCHNPKHHAYARYGGRGIDVCDRWHNFENYFEDMGVPPFSGASIDRIDNDKGYSPENCRWADRVEQQNNASNVHFLTLGTERLSISQWAKRLGVSRNRIRTRLQNGMTAEEALTLPSQMWKPREVCKNGHVRTKENTYVFQVAGKTQRSCRVCSGKIVGRKPHEKSKALKTEKK